MVAVFERKILWRIYGPIKDRYKDKTFQCIRKIGTAIRMPNLAGYMWNSEKASVFYKQMLAIYHEDLVAQGYI
jgi:hypothetical protein